MDASNRSCMRYSGGQTRIGFFVDGHAEPFTHFLQVGLEQVHMPVAVEISKLGVDGGFDALLRHSAETVSMTVGVNVPLS